MKRIKSIEEIDYSLPGYMVYILDEGVIVTINHYPSDKYDIRVTNANYSIEDFNNKSYGNNYETLQWYINKDRNLIADWVESSKITKS